MRRRVLLFVGAFALLGLAACGGGGGEGEAGEDDNDTPLPIVGDVTLESEPNDAPAGAQDIVPGTPVSGDVSEPDDVDHWRFEAQAGDVFRVTLHGTRLAFAEWDRVPNVPLLFVLAPDGETVLQTHSLDIGWVHGFHDLDFPFVLIRETGVHFLRVKAYEPGRPGGRYALELEKLALPNLQREAEPAGAAGGNDEPATAQAIVPGAVLGHLHDADEDFYRIDLPAGGPTSVDRLRFVLTAYRNGIVGDAFEHLDADLELLTSDGVRFRPVADDDDSLFSDPAVGFLSRATRARTFFLRVRGAGPGPAGAPYVLTFERRREDSVRSPGEDNTSAANAFPIQYGEIVLASKFRGPAFQQRFFEFEGRAGDLVHTWVWHAPNANFAADVIRFPDLGLRDPDGTALGMDRSGRSFDVCRVILPKTGRYQLIVDDLVDFSSSGLETEYALELELAASAAFESEPNDEPGQADVFDANGRAAGQIDDDADQDVFRFDVQEGELVNILVLAKDALANGFPASAGFEVLDGNGSRLAPTLTIAPALGAPIAFSSFTDPRQHRVSTESIVDGLATMGVSFIAPRTGTFFAFIGSKDEEAGPGHPYQLHLTRSISDR